MPTTKIKKDSHGLYVRTDGSIFRPQQSNYRYEIINDINGQSKYKEGETIKAYHCSQTPLAKVGDEYWFSHGCYIGFKDGKTFNLKSDDVWKCA